MRTNRSMPTASVIPILEYPDIAVAAKWLGDAFGFHIRLRIGEHRAQLQSGSGAIVLKKSDHGGEAPCGGSIMVRVEGIDGHFQHAARYGARVVAEPANFPYGERQYSCLDCAGHHWTFSETIADIDPALWGGELSSNEILPE